MRIAILEDEPQELKLLQEALGSYGFSDESSTLCKTFSTSSELLRLLKRETFDLIILNWQLGDVGGLQILLWIKEYLHPAPPVVMLSSRIAEHDVVQALNAGAAEFIHKPFRKAELLARLNNVLRLHQRQTQKLVARTESYGNLRFDLQDSQVYHDEKPVALTSREFSLALLLFRNQARTLSRSYLYEHLWMRDEVPSSRTLDTHIYRVRTKLKLTSEHGWSLSTAYGYGYRLDRLEN
ncbi:response regulator transcription factor [Pseudomonas protegens]|uniref:response regulator transcription factor n=1 Tax=Pseudomonas protegens TaxID=380021 RepID=UPI001C8E9D17|nr:response regulator transcription factor [Pseudomonas protegens]QZI68271.1 response regulator transcription factor [Pseudomonas protegens]